MFLKGDYFALLSKLLRGVGKRIAAFTLAFKSMEEEQRRNSSGNGTNWTWRSWNKPRLACCFKGKKEKSKRECICFCVPSFAFKVVKVKALDGNVMSVFFDAHLS